MQVEDLYLSLKIIHKMQKKKFARGKLHHTFCILPDFTGKIIILNQNKYRMRCQSVKTSFKFKN